MKIKYQLDQDYYPMIPCVHDCVIKKVEIRDDFLLFIFEDEINQHDSIQHINCKAESLVIKYHLIDDVEVFVWKNKLSLTKGGGYIAVESTKLAEMAVERLEYLYHNVGYQSMILKLWNMQSVIVDLRADYVEYEWIE